jgi:hypothetical protein
VFQTDIHPAAQVGRGVFLDHATRLVVERDVSSLQNVTLGGTGTLLGDCHPKVRKGVIIGAGRRSAAIWRLARTPRSLQGPCYSRRYRLSPP